MLIESSALVRLLLVTGVAVLMLAAWRFPHTTRVTPATQVVRLITVAVSAVLAVAIALFFLATASCPQRGCV